MYYEVNENLARRALESYSFSDYKENSATNEYRAAVDEVTELAEKQKKKVTPYYHAEIDALVDKYARKLAAWTDEHNKNTASCVSWAISGPANYPVKKHQQQMSREETLWNEYNEIQRIKDKIRSVGTGGVDLVDPYAREKLTGDLEKVRAQLETMKAANAYYRKNKTLEGCPGMTDAKLERLTRPGTYYNPNGTGSVIETIGKPFADYELTSTRNKIKRLEERLQELDKLEALQENPEEPEEYEGFQVVRNAELNRLQILFDDIPSAEIRAVLKGEAFKWSPKNQAWQRQLTDAAERALTRILPKIQ